MVPKAEWPREKSLEVRQSFLERTFEEHGVDVNTIKGDGGTLDFDSIYGSEDEKGGAACQASLRYLTWQRTAVWGNDS